MTYASKTNVPINRTRDEIESLLRRNGATSIGYTGFDDHAVVYFRIENRYVRFVLKYPDFADFARTPHNRQRGRDAQQREYDQAVRARWRALLLVIRAKFESAATGIVDIESEFLGQIVMPGDISVDDWIRPQIEKIYSQPLFNVPTLEPPPDGPLALPEGRADI